MDMDERSFGSQTHIEPATLFSKTFYALTWSGSAQLVGQLLQFVISVMLARLLSPRDFGLIGIIIIFTGFVRQFQDFGLGAALIQRGDISEDHLNTAFLLNIFSGSLLTGAFIFLSMVLSHFYNEPVLKVLTMIIGANFVIASFTVVQNALLKRKMAFQRIATIEIVSIFVSGITGILMALLGFGVWSLAGQSIIFTIMSSTLTWRHTPWKIHLSFKYKAVKDLSRFSLNLVGFNIFNYWTRNADNFLISKLLGASSLGVYSRAYTLMMIPVTQLTGFVSQVMFPALSSIQNDRERIRRVYLRITRLIAVVTCPIAMLLFVVAESFVHVIYGEKWSDVVPIFRILCIAGVLQGVGSTVGWIYTATGRTDIMLKWGIFSGTVYILSFCVGIKWGLLGVAIAYVMSGYLILWYPSWEIPGRIINLTFSDMLKNVVGPLLCSFLMSVGAWLMSNMLPNVLPEWVRLLIQVLSGVLMYVALIHTFNLEAYREIKALRMQARA